MLGRIGIGAGEQEAIVGVVSTSGPHFLTINDPLITVENSRRLERCQVGTRVGFAESLTPTRGAIHDVGQELFLLFFGAPLQQRRSNQSVAKEVSPQRRLHGCKLFGQHNTLHRGQTFAAVLLGPGCTDPTASEQLRRPFFNKLLASFARQFKSGGSPTCRQIGDQPFTDFSTESFGVGGVIQFHLDILSQVLARPQPERQ